MRQNGVRFVCCIVLWHTSLNITHVPSTNYKYRPDQYGRLVNIWMQRQSHFWMSQFKLIGKIHFSCWKQGFPNLYLFTSITISYSCSLWITSQPGQRPDIRANISHKFICQISERYCHFKTYHDHFQVHHLYLTYNWMQYTFITVNSSLHKTMQQHEIENLTRLHNLSCFSDSVWMKYLYSELFAIRFGSCEIISVLILDVILFMNEHLVTGLWKSFFLGTVAQR
jgi:hypothetical protein